MCVCVRALYCSRRSSRYSCTLLRPDRRAPHFESRPPVEALAASPRLHLGEGHQVCACIVHVRERNTPEQCALFRDVVALSCGASLVLDSVYSLRLRGRPPPPAGAGHLDDRFNSARNCREATSSGSQYAADRPQHRAAAREIWYRRPEI